MDGWLYNSADTHKRSILCSINLELLLLHLDARSIQFIHSEDHLRAFYLADEEDLTETRQSRTSITKWQEG
jgi:hypothetical protein